MQGHGDGHHGMGGMMMHGGHHKLDSATLKHFFEPLPASIIDEKKNATLIALGKKLYLDPRLSINDTISCNSCHQLNNFGVDSQPTSPGHDGTRGGRNSPRHLTLHFILLNSGMGVPKMLKNRRLAQF